MYTSLFANEQIVASIDPNNRGLKLISRIWLFTFYQSEISSIDPNIRSLKPASTQEPHF